VLRQVTDRSVAINRELASDKASRPNPVRSPHLSARECRAVPVSWMKPLLGLGLCTVLIAGAIEDCS